MTTTWTGTLRPALEGANIRCWIGFKHFHYLAEAAIAEWLLAHTPGTRRLFLDHGLGVRLRQVSAQLPAVLEIDDEVQATVQCETPGRFTVLLAKAGPDGGAVPVCKARFQIELQPLGEATVPLDPSRWPLLPPAVEAMPDPAAAARPVPDTAYAWTWTVPYYYGQFSTVAAGSAFIKTLEEAVDRFLADRGLAVPELVEDRGWIPVVSRYRLRLLADARIGEDVRSAFWVTDVLRGTLFDGVLECSVRRGEDTVVVARATILHGYAVSTGPRAGQLAELDETTIAALLGPGRPDRDGES